MKPIEIASDLKVNAGSHEGMSGKHNEDYFGVFAWELKDKRKLYLGVVADGVGGQTAGEVASHMTVSAVEKYFNELDDIDDINKHLEQAILAANKAVYTASNENPEYRGMSTTIAMVALLDGGIYTAHVGDSRIYLLRNSNLKQISTDHTWAQEAIEAGLLTRDQAKTHPNRNVIRRHLGGQLQVEVDHRLVLDSGQSAAESLQNQGTPFKKGDNFLICSDGLTDMISDDAVYESLRTNYFDLDNAVTELIDKANKAGGRDNITVVIMQVPGGPAPSPLPKAAPAAAASVAAPAAAASAVPANAVPEAAAATAASAATSAAPAKPAERKGRSFGLLAVLAIFAFVAVIVVVAAVVVFGITLGGGDENTPTALPVEVEASTEPAGSPQAPSTAAVLTTEEEATETPEAEGTSTTATPALIPTLRATSTPTPVPPTLTPTPTATNTPQPTQQPGGGNGGNGGSQPRPTSQPQPTPEPPTEEPPTPEL